MPRLSSFDLRLIRVFEAVVECGGFAAAQSRLNISTSTISTHISDFEKRIGFRLCERGRSGFRLTERGRLVYEESRKLLNRIDAYGASLAEMKDRLAGRLSIGFVDCLVSHPDFPLPNIVHSINVKNPDVEFELVVDSRHELERAVLDERLHVAIGPFVRSIAGLEFIPLFEERHEVFCGARHPLFESVQTSFSSADLADHPAAIRDYNLDFDIERFGNLTVGARISSIDAVAVLVLSGRFVGFLPSHFAAKWVKSGQMRALPGENLSYLSQQSLILKPSARQSSLVSALLEEVEREARGGR
jgi:DNA-binding transcriptional LysR family regulator